MNAAVLNVDALEGLQVERLPNGLWEAWRADDVDPEGYPRGTGKTPDEAIEDLRVELADRKESAPMVSVRDALEPSRKLCCGVLASVRCRCGQERGE